MTTQDDREWRESLFAGIVSDRKVRSRVHAHISMMYEAGDPVVTPADLMAARHYLRKCMTNMTSVELEIKTEDDLAALWARGAVGAAKYRGRDRPGGRTARRKDADREAE
jgi:hypothetical protein